LIVILYNLMTRVFRVFLMTRDQVVIVIVDFLHKKQRVLVNIHYLNISRPTLRAPTPIIPISPPTIWQNFPMGELAFILRARSHIMSHPARLLYGV